MSQPTVDSGGCKMIVKITVWLVRSHSETVRWVLDTLWNVDPYMYDMVKSVH